MLCARLEARGPVGLRAVRSIHSCVRAGVLCFRMVRQWWTCWCCYSRIGVTMVFVTQNKTRLCTSSFVRNMCGFLRILAGAIPAFCAGPLRYFKVPHTCELLKKSPNSNRGSLHVYTFRSSVYCCLIIHVHQARINTNHDATTGLHPPRGGRLHRAAAKHRPEERPAAGQGRARRKEEEEAARRQERQAQAQEQEQEGRRRSEEGRRRRRGCFGGWRGGGGC